MVLPKDLKFKVGPRMGFVAASNYTWLSIDYSGQELMIASAISKDKAMETAFLSPAMITKEDGSSYKNPYADLHALTAVKCCAPHLFQGIPEDKWVELAAANGTRQRGKITNFGIIYLQTAESLSEQNYVKLEETKLWVKNHKLTYPGYHRWTEEFGGIALARGFSVSPISGLVRWIDEENSKGAGTESPLRAAVNACIDGCP
jgi:DNA polymerase I-like protein with 3'-5' exonuclease and polymerase domains